MGKIKIHAGSFGRKGTGSYSWGTLTLQGRVISPSSLESVEIATEDNVKKVGGTVGWGVAGGVLLGPLGLVGGLVLGGRKKEVTFVARFKDGKKLLATTDRKTFKKLQALAF